MTGEVQEGEVQETELSHLAQKIIAHFQGASQVVLFLEGPLGAGKSTFARALLRELDPNLRFSGSPTFPVIHDYGKAIHMDLYRIETADELEPLGVWEYLRDESPHWVIIEWGSRFPDLDREMRTRSKSIKAGLLELEFSERGESIRSYSFKEL